MTDPRLVDAELRESGLRWAFFDERETRQMLAALDFANRSHLVRGLSTLPALEEELRTALESKEARDRG